MILNIPFTGKYARNKSAVFKDLSASFNPFTAFNASALERSVSFSNKIRLNEKYINMLRRMSNKINIPAVYTFIFSFSFIFPPSVHSQPLELCELEVNYTVYRFYSVNNEYIRPPHLCHQNNHIPTHHLIIVPDLTRFVHFLSKKQASQTRVG